MSKSSMLRPALSAVFVAALLAGCAAIGGEPHRPTGTTHGSGSMGAGGNMDMQAMCEMHTKMMAGKTPQERKAMMDERMKSMSAEERQRMEAMMQRCG
jgi:hypothetical protein